MSQRMANRLKCLSIQSTTFKYDNSEEMAMLFDLKKEGYFYTRTPEPYQRCCGQENSTARRVAWEPY